MLDEFRYKLGTNAAILETARALSLLRLLERLIYMCPQCYIGRLHPVDGVHTCTFCAWQFTLNIGFGGYGNWDIRVDDEAKKKMEEAANTVPCDRCNASGEGQRWSETSRCMETVPHGCTWCKGTGRRPKDSIWEGP